MGHLSLTSAVPPKQLWVVFTGEPPKCSFEPWKTPLEGEFLQSGWERREKEHSLTGSVKKVSSDRQQGD